MRSPAGLLVSIMFFIVAVALLAVFLPGCSERTDRNFYSTAPALPNAPETVYVDTCRHKPRRHPR